MKQLLANFKDYNLYRIGSEYLNKIADFVVRENYIHHKQGQYPSNMREEINQVYKEEKSYLPQSQIFIAEDKAGKLIGCIRVLLWDNHSQLPMERIFGINPLTKVPNAKTKTFWHVGRFAIDDLCGIPSLLLFKQLMALVIRPIVNSSNGCMLAETDCKLLHIMNLLTMKTCSFCKGQVYLGSETIPIYALKNDLKTFYNKNKSLLQSKYNRKIAA